MDKQLNLLLRCSILLNIAVFLYLCSHAMIDNLDDLTSGTEFLPPEHQMLQEGDGGGGARDAAAGVKKDPIDDKLQQIQNPSESVGGGGGGGAGGGGAGLASTAGSSDNLQQPPAKDSDAPEMYPNIGDPANVIGSIGSANNGNNNNNFLNNTNADKDFEERLRSLLKCYDKPYEAEILRRGHFWVLKNYIRAEHGKLKCHESITYTTHADYTFLDNLIPLLDRWNAPISIAMHAPGTDFQSTLDSIKYLRDCLPNSHLVRQYATFHIYFSTQHIPKWIPKNQDALKIPYNCSLPAPYVNVTSGDLYKTQQQLFYPVNVGRNIARDAAITHFLLASDIELYPNRGLVKKFLEMIARNEPYLHGKSPRVFSLSIFEVDENSPVPRNKTELQEFLRTGKAITYHKRVCASCHGPPKFEEWIAANETKELSVFHIGKRTGEFVDWEPIYIGTNAEPHYDERLSWEGRSDKMAQAYALCVLDYEFHILDNAFIVHKPGIQIFKWDTRGDILVGKTNQVLNEVIYPELKIMYGTRNGCAV